MATYSESAINDARWIMTFETGIEWLRGTFQPNREVTLIKMGVLIPTDKEGVFITARIELPTSKNPR